MKNLAASVFAFFCIVPLMSCGSSRDAAIIYVITPPQKASRFSDDLAKIARRHHLTPNLGQATDDRGLTNHVLKAEGTWVTLWSENQFLSGHENAAQCGVYSEPHPDPGQYFISIDHRLPLIARNVPRELISEIGNELKASGYDVRKSPILCSPLSKERSDAMRH